ncbi:unnamed protein product [Bursaphelenchus xylophilus]|uniref:(pine wood nematode) hypothetical protein n=1 Tax=Bursaphelenchus xylophilus TaxID=6326 RepID=A0A1I7SBH2_BURXY|nr:unnamed protein product [Bursaphelenchus xylophilus]CAG9122001.1 unnamed protein product [Bursaphelenchus xylophilus]
MSTKRYPQKTERLLESLGIVSPSSLRDRLLNAPDLKEEIRKFQAENQIPVPSLRPILNILDLHGVRRNELNQVVLKELTGKLLDKIKDLSPKKNPKDAKKLEELLDKIFRLYPVESMRKIVLETLKSVPQLSNKYLKKIADDKLLYSECDVSVKQQIWVVNEKLFHQAIEPIIDEYVDEKEKILTLTGRSQTNFFTSDTTKIRRQWKQVKDLIQMSGRNPSLYKGITDLVQLRYLETGSCHYASLRLELAMALHDLNVEFATKTDPIHDFAWVLDVALRDRHMDTQQVNKLKNVIDKKKFLEENFKNVALVAADPHVLHLLCSMTLKIIFDSTKTCNQIPRDHTLLHLIIRLLYFGLYSREIINEEKEFQSVINADCLVKFLPAMTEVILRDQVRMELQKASDEVSDEFMPEFEIQRPSDTFCTFIKQDSVCALLFSHYVFSILPAKKRGNSKKLLLIYLDLIFQAKDKIVFEEPWAHLLLFRMSHYFGKELERPELCKLIITDALLPALQTNPNIAFHLLRLISLLKGRIQEEYVNETLTSLDPTVYSLPPFLGHSSLARFEKEYATLASALKPIISEQPVIYPNMSDVLPQEPQDILSSIGGD